MGKDGNRNTIDKKKMLIAGYGAVVSFLTLVSVVFASVYLYSKGVSVPWVSESETCPYTLYEVNPIFAVVLSLIIGAGITIITDKIAKRRGTRYYYYGIVVVILVVAIAVLIVFGGSCSLCAAWVCGWGNVKECGVVWSSLFKIAVKCVCK